MLIRINRHLAGLMFYILFAAQTFVFASNKCDPKIVVLTCSYKNRAYCKKNLESVFKQTYANWEMYYVDDASPDGTAELVEQIVQQSGLDDKVHLIKNTTRMRALANIYHTIHRLSSDSIVVMLDGDDYFIDDSVLQYIADVYRDPNVWLTYGSYVASNPPFPVFCEDVSSQYSDCVDPRTFFRECPWCFSHLRTFYAGLFQQIKKQDLMQGGDFFPTAYDVAIMTPMLEMCGGRFRFIDRPLYVYNNENPICDYKVESSTVIPDYIRSLPVYDVLEKI